MTQCRFVPNKSGTGQWMICARGTHRSGVFFLLRTLVSDALLGLDFLLRLSLAVDFLLPLRLFLDSQEVLRLVLSTGCRKPCQHHGPIPGTEPLQDQLAAQDLAGPGGMMQADRTATQIQQQLSVCILFMLFSEFLLLILQRLLNHAADRRLVNILSSGICHECFLSIKKPRQ